MTRILWLCPLLVLVLTPLAATQDADQEQRPRPIGGLTFRDEVEVTVVNVIVYVTDQEGEPVTDLGRHDFRILQDGLEREITNFDLFSEESYRHWYGEAKGEDAVPIPTPAATELESPQPRPIYTVLYVDSANLHPLDRNRVLRQAQRFVRESMVPPVQMMVVSFDTSLRIVEPFTDSPTEVLDALRGMVRLSGGRESRDKTRREILDKMRRYAEDPGASMLNSASRVQGEMIAFAEEEVNDLSFTLSALRDIVSSLSGLPGKKSIVYVSNGLPMIAGIDLLYAYANAYEDPSIMTLTARYDQSRHFESLVSAANAHDVAFYTVGAGGLKHAAVATAEYARPMDTTAMSMGEQNYVDSLRFMAERTGGMAIVNTNDVSIGLERVTRDMFTYYSLGYPLNRSGGDKVHHLEVELPNHPEYAVRFRSRFVEKSLESQVRDAVLGALMFPVEDNPMDIDFAAGDPAPATGDRWMVPIHVSFPLDRVALIPEGEDYVGRVVLFIAARSTRGRQSDLVRQEHEVRVPAAHYDQAQLQRFGIDLSLLMEGGTYRVAVGLMDQVTRRASYQTQTAAVGGPS